MLNQIYLVGRLIDLPEIKEDNVYITILVNRSYKNTNGEYENDIFKIKIWEGLKQQVIEKITKNDVVGIRGILQNNNNQIEILADKISFLSHKGD